MQTSLVSKAQFRELDLTKGCFHMDAALGRFAARYHCLRLPEEGPCECDLYLTCAKFITTPEYAPRLRERRLREIALTDEARVRGAGREAERHDCTRTRIEQLLSDLGVSIGVE